MLKAERSVSHPRVIQPSAMHWYSADTIFTTGDRYSHSLYSHLSHSNNQQDIFCAYNSYTYMHSSFTYHPTEYHHIHRVSISDRAIEPNAGTTQRTNIYRWQERREKVADKVYRTYFGSRKHRQNVHPPFGLLSAGRLYEMHLVVRGDGQTVRISSQLLGFGYVHHFIHVDAGLRYRFRL